MSAADPARLIDELTADLEPEDAAELALELARMIDLGLLELDDDEGRVGIAAPPAQSSSITARRYRSGAARNPRVSRTASRSS
jgi:hypothetical protein